MLYNPENRISLRLFVGLCVLAISTGLEVSTARAQEAAEDASTATTGSMGATASAAATVSAPTTEATTEVTPLKPVDVHPGAKPAQAAGDPSRPYFIEFRARAAYNYGHSFVVHGRVGEPITKKSVVGLHPAGDSPVPWMIGHIIPVPSETGWSDGDVGYNDRYITAKYRVFLTEAEYRVLLAKLRQMQANTPLWSAPVYNCVAFVGDIAAFLGMEHPFHLVMPKEYILGIRDMNKGRQQLPSSWLASRDPQAARQQAAQLAAAHQQAQHREVQQQQVQQQAAPAATQSAQQQAAPAASQPAQQQAAPAAPNVRRQRAAGPQAAARPLRTEAGVPSYAAVH